MDLSIYKDKYVKLLNVNNMAEIFGIMIDYTGDFICLDKPVMSINQYQANPSFTQYEIINLKYNAKNDGSDFIARPLSALYANAPNDKSIAWFNLSSYVFIPVEYMESDSSLMEEYVSAGKGFIKYLYENYYEAAIMMQTEREKNKDE